MKKPIPSFQSDDAAEAFVETANLADYDLSGGQFMRFELKPKDRSVNLRLPDALLEAVRNQAQALGIPYQRFIRLVLEWAVTLERK